MLFVCATPIGNLKDISLRALEILASSDIVLCEDTRMSKRIFSAHNITYKKLIALHAHNENEIANQVIGWLADGLTITQISDAGTPGISDPGARLCNIVRSHGYTVSPIPGACAYISLLSVSGLSCSSLFHGFLPSQKTARQKVINSWLQVDYAICIYEAPHRIIECLEDIVECLGEAREVVMGRELTKQFETIRKMPAKDMLDFILSDSNQQRGEFVLLIAPNAEICAEVEHVSPEQARVLSLLLSELPPKKAVGLTSKIVGGNKDLLYNLSISLNKKPVKDSDDE